MSESLMSKRARRVRWTPAERTEWLELYRASGQTVAAFCRANEIACKHSGIPVVPRLT
jgi:transposase-like protein